MYHQEKQKARLKRLATERAASDVPGNSESIPE